MNKKLGATQPESSKTRGRTSKTHAQDFSGGGTKMNMNRKIRNDGTNRLVGKADHLHRGDRRDMNKVMK